MVPSSQLFFLQKMLPKSFPNHMKKKIIISKTTFH